MNNSDMPAMPLGKDGSFKDAIGLTKREHFAGLAMQGLLSNSGAVLQSNTQSGFAWCNCDDEQMAQLAIDCADALLAKLDKSK
jgi:hypothetical protein